MRSGLHPEVLQDSLEDRGGCLMHWVASPQNSETGLWGLGNNLALGLAVSCSLSGRHLQGDLDIKLGSRACARFGRRRSGVQARVRFQAAKAPAH